MSDRGKMTLVPVVARRGARLGMIDLSAFKGRPSRTPLQIKLSLLRMEFNRASRKASRRLDHSLSAIAAAFRAVFPRPR